MAGNSGIQRSAPAWHRLAQPTARLRAVWVRGADYTRWRACGQSWDAVAITPMSLGLDALAAMRLGPRSGHPVLADHVRDQLYVLVPPGMGSAAAGLTGVRVLSTGHQLLVPATEHGTATAHWISPPRETPALLVRADRLAHHLRALARHESQKAAAS